MGAEEAEMEGEEPVGGGNHVGTEGVEVERGRARVRERGTRRNDGGRERKKCETKKRGVVRHDRWGEIRWANGGRGKRKRKGRGMRETNRRRGELEGVGLRKGMKKGGRNDGEKMEGA